MAEANNQTETILEDDNQTNETGHEQNPNKSRVNHDPKAEKPIVYRNYGSVTVKPLLLTNHHWSTKDIKERLSSTAQSSNVTVTQHNSMLAQGKYASVEENVFKRQDSITSQHREPPVDSTPDNCDVKPLEADSNLITSNSEINYEISGEEN
ncbi:uncharacterized protein LOC132739584 [Ruditapes philippinarum]|uniref:uncharacterized protein LOC132739584 n=1 Tax=Ruditapes philippinarum TaxID=129788 RepID=UPI00295B69D6|nr:uncharacterized protein LOC132739584 [Ruditapes philippinarum]